MVRPVSSSAVSPSLAGAAPVVRRPQAANPESAAAPADAPAPPGASPALWSLLTADERAFFFDQAALGAATYQPGGRPAESAPAPLGQRVDVRG